MKSEQELVQLKVEQEETALSHLFEKQSQEVQQIMKNKQKLGLKNAMQHNLKHFLEWITKNGYKSELKHQGVTAESQYLRS